MQDTDTILQVASEMLKEGATILDIGGQSTRPGSVRLLAEEELKRVLPVIESIHKKFPDAFISVDTYPASVAEQAIAAGASIINDISGGTMDNEMLITLGRLHVPYVCMHIQGNLKPCNTILFMKM